MAGILKKGFIFVFTALLALSVNLQIKGFCAPVPVVKQATLDKIAKLPRGSSDNPKIIVDLFLADMGYPKNLIMIKYFDSSTSGGMFEGDYTQATFNLASGELSLNNDFARHFPPKMLAPVIRHELDHFEKGAQICKSIGITSYGQLWTNSSYGNEFNRVFWQKAINYTNINGFDTKRYLNGIVKYSVNRDITSPYYVFADKTDGVRNPLEISAYAVSDAIYKYYGLSVQDTTMKTIALAFNRVDWQVYKIASQNPYLANSRVAIFDYYYLRALVANDQTFLSAYQEALRTGSMTKFWNLYKNTMKSFYVQSSNQLSAQTIEKITAILNTMSNLLNKPITIKQVQEIFDLKYATLTDALKQSSNAAYRGNLLLLLKQNVNDYLKFLDTYGVNEDKVKLKLLVTKLQFCLIKVTNTNAQSEYLENPANFLKIANEIYNNKVFKQMLQNRKGVAFMEKEVLLRELVEKNKLIK